MKFGIKMVERGENGVHPAADEKMENGVNNDNGDDNGDDQDQDKVVEYDPTHRYGRVR